MNICSASDTAEFTQTLADSASFPAGSTLSFKKLYDDTVSTDPMAVGQRYLSGKLSYASSYRLGQLALTTFYSYDDRGRVEWVIQKGLGTYYKKISYAFDRASNVIAKAYLDQYATMNTDTSWYHYDVSNRLDTMYNGGTLSTRMREAAYQYLANGLVQQLIRGGPPAADTISYNYNERDWVTRIKSSTFLDSLYYNIPAYGTQAQYNGNISASAWTAASLGKLTYAFKYDGANRLLQANPWQSTPYTMGIQYDASGVGNGNIDTLWRYGSAGVMDRLKYHYVANTNKLDYITDQVAANTYSTDIDNQSPGNYKYDGNGNMQSALGDGVAFVVYDVANLPVTEYKLDGTVIQYSYDANGNRIQKIVGGTASYYVLGADGKAEVLSSGDNQQPIYNIWAGDNIGQIKRNVSRMPRYYYVKDHLGDIRVTVNSTGVVDSYFDYYPFGQLMDGRNSVASADPRYKYTGKERDVETNYDYFGARYYDARVGRFLSVDPLAENYPETSPYCYALNNPIRLTDPTGLAPSDSGTKLCPTTRYHCH